MAALAWNQHILVAGDRAGTIMFYDVWVWNTAKVTLHKAHGYEVCGLKWSPDFKRLASGGNDNIVNIYNAMGVKLRSLTEHQAAVKALAWCPWQCNLLATGGGAEDRAIKFWNTTTGVCLHTLQAHAQVSSLLWNKQEIIAGLGYNEHKMVIWHYPTLAKVAELDGHTERILAMAMSPDGTNVISAGGDETLRLWKCFTKTTPKKAAVCHSKLLPAIR